MLDGSTLRARDFGFTYRGASRPALQGIDVELEPGQCLLVVGPSGSGKSTLGLAVSGLVPREIGGTVAGSLAIDGREAIDYAPATLAATVGLVFQDPAVQIVLDRVEDDVAFGLENRGWPRSRMVARVPAALGAVGLGGLERRQTRTLSGGQQQRLALAGVLAAEPRVLVLDEPTANLDPAGAAALFERLAALKARRAATIVLVEHHVDAAWPLADVVLALGPDGSPIAVGPPDVVLREASQQMAAAGIWLPAGSGRADAAGRPAGAAADPARAAGHPAGAAADPAGAAADPAPAAGNPAGVAGDPARAAGVPALLVAHDLRFGYDRGTPVLRDIEFSARAGERIALVGPNGGGKSTLARLLVGLLRPVHGTVSLAGQDPGRIAPASLARLAGYVFQRPEEQFLTQRVVDEIGLGLGPAERKVATGLMDRLGLPLGTFGERSPYRLSGGEQRRLSLACALVRRPAVLILDEPTFGQDRHGYQGLLAIVRELVAAGTCLIAATHDVRFVRDAAERVVTLEDGWLVRDDVVVGE